MDPRVKSGTLALQQQFTIAKQVYDAIGRIQGTLPLLAEARQRAQAAGNTELAQKLQALAGAGGGRGGRGGGGGGRGGGSAGPPSLGGYRRSCRASTVRPNAAVPCHRSKRSRRSTPR